MGDIEYMTSWMTHLKTLKCTKIPVDNGSAFIPNLSHIYGLITLDLQFARPCSLKLTYFISAPDLKRLPSSLTHLKITDIQDKEEDDVGYSLASEVAAFLTYRSNIWDYRLSPDEVMMDWTKSEEQLVLKYKMLTFLTNLTSLSLHSVSSFTSRVWRECMIPCSSKLRHLSLSGWEDIRESPQDMIDRFYAYRETRETHLKRSKVDLAVFEFFSSLTHIESIFLYNFLCTHGVVNGISALDKNYTIRGKPNISIALCLHDTLDNFNMTFSNKSEQES